MQHVGLGVDPDRAVKQMLVVTLGGLLEDIAMPALQLVLAHELQIVIREGNVGGGVVVDSFGFAVQHLADDAFAEGGGAMRLPDDILLGIGRNESDSSYDVRLGLVFLLSKEFVF